MRCFDGLRRFGLRGLFVLTVGMAIGCQNAVHVGDDLRLSLEVPSEVAPGQSVTLMLHVSNDGPGRRHLAPNGYPTGFEILVLREDGTQVWSSYSDDITIADSERHFDLAKDEKVTFQAVWEQTVVPSGSVPPGEYFAVGILRESESRPRSVKASFVIRPQSPS